MPEDIENLVAVGYFICGVVFSTWRLYRLFKGGADSLLQRQLKHSPVPIAPVSVYIGTLIVVLGTVFVWPVMFFLSVRKRRVDVTPYKNRRLTKLKSALTGHEANFEQILTDHKLGAVATAITALDLKDFNGVDSHANVVEYTLTYVDYMALFNEYRHGKHGFHTSQDYLRRAVELKQGLGEKHGRDALAVGNWIGLVLIGNMSGWLTEFDLNATKAWYGAHLLEQYDTNDHMQAVFAAVSSRSVHRAPDWTPEREQRALNATEEEED